MELGLGPTKDGFRSAIAECGAQRRWERALLLVTKLERRQLHPDESIMAAAMKAVSLSAQWVQALHLLGNLPKISVKINARHCTIAISAMQPSGDWARALSLLASMAPRDLQPTVDTYTWTICTCAKASEWSRAFNLRDQMMEEGMQPNKITYRQLAVMCRKEALWEHGLQLLADAQASQVAWDVPVVLGAVGMSCVRAQQWQRAAAVLAEFEGQLMETNYFWNLAQIRILAEREQCDGWEAAFAWLSEQDLDSFDDETVCPAISACGAQWQKALEWLLALQEGGTAVTTAMYQELVRIRATGGEDEDEDYDMDEDWPLA